MGHLLEDLPFKDWVRHIFGHEVSEPAWYWDIDVRQYDNGPAVLVVAHLTRLFENAAQVLKAYPAAWVNQGFWYLLAGSNYPQAIIDTTVPLEDRIGCIRAMRTLFADVFSVRCTHHLSHKDEPGCGPLNRMCYMWWDVLPLHGLASRGGVDEACLEVMKGILDLPHVACRESALHGLSHWHSSRPQQAARIIDDFLNRDPGLSADLKAYALNARNGCVL